MILVQPKLVPLVNLVPETMGADLLLVTQRGRMKRLAPSEFEGISNRGLSAVKLKGDDALLAAIPVDMEGEVVLATSGGRLLRFEANAENLARTGRAAQGQQALRLRQQERVTGCVVTTAERILLLVTAQGYAKRLPVRSLRLAKRGEIGTQALQFANKTDVLVGAIAIPERGRAIAMTSNGRSIALPAASVSLCGKDGKGDRFESLRPDERIVSIALCIE